MKRSDPSRHPAHTRDQVQSAGACDLIEQIVVEGTASMVIFDYSIALRDRERWQAPTR